MSLLPFAAEIIYNNSNSHSKKIKHTHANKRDGAPHKIKRRQRTKTTAHQQQHMRNRSLRSMKQIENNNENERDGKRECDRAMRTYTWSCIVQCSVHGANECQKLHTHARTHTTTRTTTIIIMKKKEWMNERRKRRRKRSGQVRTSVCAHARVLQNSIQRDVCIHSNSWS